MRIVSPAAGQAILASVRKTIRASGFRHEDEWSRVLSGEEEGVFGWLAVNSLLKRVDGPTSATAGAVDVGGASAQISFRPSEAILAGLFTMDIASLTHRIYTHSFL